MAKTKEKPARTAQADRGHRRGWHDGRPPDEPLVLLHRDRACTRCTLHETPNLINRCIPMRRLRPGDEANVGAGPKRKSRALLIVGEAPGYHEDKHDMCFVPHGGINNPTAGEILERVYLSDDPIGLPSLCDVYATNAVRCRPPRNATPTNKHRVACRAYLFGDLGQLRSLYTEVYILCVGASAAWAVLNCKLEIGRASCRERV